jgi:hypothetical protein
MKKKKKTGVKLPAAVVETLRKRGGAHSSRKGKKGYSRKNNKARDEDLWLFSSLYNGLEVFVVPENTLTHGL